MSIVKLWKHAIYTNHWTRTAFTLQADYNSLVNLTNQNFSWLKHLLKIDIEYNNSMSKYKFETIKICEGIYNMCTYLWLL